MTLAALTKLQQDILNIAIRHWIVTLSFLKTRVKGAGVEVTKLENAGYLRLLPLYPYPAARIA